MSLKREEVGENRMAAGVGRCCCRLPPSSLALKGSSWSGADTEVGSDDKRYSQSIRCCEAFRPLLSSAQSCQFVYLLFVTFNLGLTSSRQWGCWGSFLGTVWEVRVEGAGGV